MLALFVFAYVGYLVWRERAGGPVAADSVYCFNENWTTGNPEYFRPAMNEDIIPIGKVIQRASRAASQQPVVVKVFADEGRIYPARRSDQRGGNGDDPMPQDQVVSSRPPMTIKAIDEKGVLRDISPSEAFQTAHVRDMRRFKKVGPWVVAIFLIGLLSAIVLGQPDDGNRKIQPTALSAEVTNNVDLSAGKGRLKGMSVQLLNSVGDKSGLDCVNDSKLLVSVERVHRKVFPSSAIVERGIESVPIEGGTARLIGFRRAFQPGDQDVVETGDDFYLVGRSCSVIAL